MKFKNTMVALLSVTTIAGCQQKTTPTSSLSVEDMEAVVAQKVFYQNLPSASGIESAGIGYYVVGDDSPYLYLLDASYTLVEKTPLFDTTSFAGGRIPKLEKADLESMAQFRYKDADYLLLLGSGATANRNKAFIVRQPDAKEVRAVDISTFYTFLQKILARQASSEVLNIEGLAADDTHFYLLQRRLAAGVNTIFRFKKEEFLRYLMEEGDLPVAAAFYIRLPQIGPYEAGLSGACIYDDKLFFSASIERTLNAVDDGEVLGSFVGFIPLYTLGRAGDAANPLEVAAVQLKNADGTMYTGKAESVVVQAKDESGGYKAILVSDDDQGHSELLEVTLRPRLPAKP
ncbi:hypothetical protein I2I11_09230 [Pontibacter sp. 172403-2]|uniref:DUF6929 family protein n=1 Tax=Pontibacter rufus TaxID=2791028 RepID=UPI0018AFC9F4|nr:hypothetical protein [Pontibacter sp. 172403-2]MBF9253472.1 hypothetical protein [Pontibacter sp. 172403-2]